MAPATFNDLPSELLDHITSYLPTAGAVANLGATSKSLHSFVEEDAWQTFARTRFPSLHPTLHLTSTYSKAVARSLTTVSKAWDRRALLARYIEPHGDVIAYPGGKKLDRWKRPRGQTIGFTPQLDVYEDVGPRWQDRREVLAFSAGAEVCVRERKRRSSGKEEVRWRTYRPVSAREGRDDITTLHLLKGGGGVAEKSDDAWKQRLVTGTANGDLWMLDLPIQPDVDVSVTHFTTQGLSVRSSSILERTGDQKALLAANLSDSRISLYQVDNTQPKIAPINSIEIYPPPRTNPIAAKSQRVWSTQFLSFGYLAVGLGPAAEPIHVYTLTPTGLSQHPTRKFSLRNEFEGDTIEVAGHDFSKKPSTSIYPILTIPSSAAGGSQQEGNVFLSGAFDGVIRLHDLRSHRQVEQEYVDPTDDSAIYSLLARGQEAFLAGTSRHSLLKVFDLRLGAKCYSYLDAQQAPVSVTNGESQHYPKHSKSTASRDWNLFLKSTSRAVDWQSGGGGGRGRARQNWDRQRTAESSIYNLASPSPYSPYVYAGVENAVLELGFHGALDAHPDPVFIRPWAAPKNGREDPWHAKEVLDLAMVDQTPNMKLYTQRSLWETWRARQSPVGYTFEFPRVEWLDERWRVGSG